MTPQANAAVRGKILVIDDNPIIQRAVLYALRDKGYTVLMCGEVNGAMSIIRKERPDLILLDLSFPIDQTNFGGPLQDGFFFIDWFCRTPEIQQIPIMIISGSEPSTYKERAAAAGITVFLRKPVDKTALAAAVEQALAKKSAGSQPDQSTP